MIRYKIINFLINKIIFLNKFLWFIKNTYNSNDTLRKKASFIDNNPLFEDLNASFKRLYKSILDKRDVFESGSYLYAFLFHNIMRLI